MALICVDISRYQAGFNFQTFKNSGGLGVIMKASQGSSSKDSSYSTFRPQAKAAGLAIATYHYFDTSDPTAQANFYLDTADPDDGERVVCDFEASGVTVAKMISFFQQIQARNPTLQLTVYSGHMIKDALGSTTDAWLAANTSLWIAQYTNAAAPSWPTGTWKQWSLWQYSDQLTAPGFNGPVDQNRFNGPDSQFLKWIGPAAAPPAPGPEPAGTPTVTVTLASDSPVNLVIQAGQNVTIGGS